VVLGLARFPWQAIPSRSRQTKGSAGDAVERQERKRAESAGRPKGGLVGQHFAQAQSGQVKELNLILSGLQGSIEPIVNSLSD